MDSLVLIFGGISTVVALFAFLVSIRKFRKNRIYENSLKIKNIQNLIQIEDYKNNKEFTDKLTDLYEIILSLEKEKNIKSISLEIKDTHKRKLIEQTYEKEKSVGDISGNLHLA